jgi:hypothetical protein
MRERLRTLAHARWLRCPGFAKLGVDLLLRFDNVLWVSRIADPVSAAQVGRLHPGLVLLQDRDDLLFRMPLPLHRLVLSSGPDSIRIQMKGQCHDR